MAKTPRKVIDVNALKLEMRLTAIEFMVCRITAVSLVASGKTVKDLQKWRAELKQTLQAQTFAGLDAVVSDAFAAEQEEAVDALLALLKSHMSSLTGKDRRRD